MNLKAMAERIAIYYTRERRRDFDDRAPKPSRDMLQGMEKQKRLVEVIKEMGTSQEKEDLNRYLHPKSGMDAVDASKSYWEMRKKYDRFLTDAGWRKFQERAQAPSHAPAHKTVVDSESAEKIQILDKLKTKVKNWPEGAAHVEKVQNLYEGGKKPDEDDLKKLRNILYRSGMRPEADHFRTAKSLQVKLDAPRNPYEKERGTRGWGGGSHHNRDKDVDQGRSRKEKHKKDWRDKDGTYSGNPDGKPIYPNKIDHGYDEPLAGGTDVMRRLQNQLLHEQGNTDLMRPNSPRLAFRGNDPTQFDLGQQYLAQNAVRFPASRSDWWLPAHNLGIKVSGKAMSLWVFTILPPNVQDIYLADMDSIALRPSWKPHPKHPGALPATEGNVRQSLTMAKVRPTVGETIKAELKWIENHFGIAVPADIEARLVQSASKLAAKQWGLPRAQVHDVVLSLVRARTASGMIDSVVTRYLADRGDEIQ